MPNAKLNPTNEQSITHLPLARLFDSKLNPRKKYHGIDELAVSIQSQGILQPLVVRQNGKGYEIVCGHRRSRAASRAGLTHVPAVIRTFASDDDVLAAQITENCIREDIHPMEEAEAYAKLQKTGYSVAQIASMVGKAESHIYKRLRLCTLSPTVRTAFAQAKIPVGVAYVLARMPTHELQDEALNAVQATAHTEAATTREVTRYIERNYMLRLSEAPFSRTDTALVSEAGACTNCPKQTKNQPVLFDDMKRKSICTDPACYRAKTEANWLRAAEKAVSCGLKVLSAAKAKKVFRNGSEHVSPGSSFVDPKAPHPQDPEGRSWQKLLGRDAPPAILCMNPRGKPVKLLQRTEAAEALKAKGVTFVRPAAPAKTNSTPSPDEQLYKERHQRRQEAHRASLAVLGQLTERFRERGLCPAAWRHVLSLVIDSYAGPNDERFDAANHALESDEDSVLHSAIAGLVLWQATESARYEGERPKGLDALAKLYDVDYDTVEKKVKKELLRQRRQSAG